MKKLAIVCFALLFVVGNVFGQDQEVWKFSHLLFDFQKPQSNAWGIHGVAVDPDGKVWLSIHGNLHGEPVTNANGDTLGWYRPIYVLDPNTGEHVSFSPLKVLEMPDGTLDTLWTESAHNGSGKGISVDMDGNILATSWSTLYRIDYKTGKVLNRFIPDDKNSMTEAVQDGNGNIYIGYVLSKERPVYILDNDFNLIGNAIDTLGYINRTLAVSYDGKDLYTGSTWNGFGVVQYHSDLPGVIKFAPVDTFANLTNVYDPATDSTWAEVKMWASCLDWDPDSNLVVGKLRSDWSGPGGSKYYAFNVQTKEIVWTVGKPVPHDSSDGGVYSPRGAAWTADGQTMYLADYDYNVVSVWNRVLTSVETNVPMPVTFDLGQNYPNPFNPSTTIPFSLNRDSHVILRVYDVRGRLVATLLDRKMNAGKHAVLFDATGLPTGVYYYRLEVDGELKAKQMMFLK
ncbi:MAG: T9SS type A sorting domain-containing protein [candidate division KSB1 bacterium]|nr:T9SS type A sorting domain-containing protein [candidate division KSB1 bacterium]